MMLWHRLLEAMTWTDYFR